MVQIGQTHHVLLVELKVEDGQILHHVFRVSCARIDDDLLLQMPAKGDLGGCSLVLCSDASDRGMRAKIGDRVPRWIESHHVIRTADGRVAVEGDIVPLAEVEQLVLVPIGMEFDLIDAGNGRVEVEDFH